MAEPLTLERSLLLDEPEIAELAATFETRPPQELVRWAFGHFGDGLAIATSFQAEGMALLDMAWRIDPRVRVITVDSGRLRQETYDLIDRVRERYAIAIEVFSPESRELESFVGEHGPNSFYRSLELRVRCCDIRKVSPLNRALSGLDAWVSGQRRDHLATRRSIRVVERDAFHGGIVKLNPLAHWSNAQVWEYLRAHDVPHNTLYDQGFTSIGCAPCTRPTRPGDDPRSGRWWWEGEATKECGMHCRVDWSSLRA
ncbi:MAG: phosphoadenylyl-sulfate reductase [Chloroflexia bacterium]|nr:phosphoadenylyl-sulfate reductase [Chloroflexia bacterium]